MSPNLNSASASTTQAMLLLGTFNTSLWSDDNGLESGEVVSDNSRRFTGDDRPFMISGHI